MTDRELMQMALDALESVRPYDVDNLYGLDDEITALRDRLAQPEPEPVCDKNPLGCWSVRCQLGRVCKNTASPKREWVGLTDDEVYEIADISDCFEDIVEATAAKLKEKNT